MTALEPGRYVCVATPGLAGWLIRKATRSPYNHVFIVGAHGMIVEASMRQGVRAVPLHRYAGMRACADTAEPLTAAQAAAVLGYAAAAAGDPYNFPDLAGLALASIGLHWRILLRLAGARGAFICSQLAAAAGAAAGLDWMCGQPTPAQVTPALLARRPPVRKVTIP